MSAKWSCREPTNKGKRKDTVPFCKECCFEVTDKNWLYCQICEKETCITCLGMPIAMYELVASQNKRKQRIPCVEVICKNCKDKPSLNQLSGILEELQKTQNFIIKFMQQVESKLKGLENGVNCSVKETIKTQIEDQLSAKLFTEMQEIETRLEAKEAIMEQKLLDHVDSKLKPLEVDSQFGKKIAEIVREEKREDIEREKRKASLIMYNVPEPAEGEPDKMKNEDLQSVKYLIKNILKEKDEYIQITNVIRLGRRRDEYIRPLKVIFSDANQKFSILKKSSNLNSSTDTKCSSVYVVPDKTDKERKEYRKLKDEMERLGDPDLIIRRGKIVKRGQYKINNDNTRIENLKSGRSEHGEIISKFRL